MFLSHLNNNSRSAINPKEQEDLLDDPLLLYEQRICEKHLNTESLLNLLQETVVKYGNDARYKNSPRYLRLWFMYILYLKCCTVCNILPILYNLIDNHIGDKLAALYEAIAYYQLQQRKIQEAEIMLLLGIYKKAEPIKRLKHVLDRFYIEETIEFDINQYKLQQQDRCNSSLQVDINTHPDQNITSRAAPSSPPPLIEKSTSGIVITQQVDYFDTQLQRWIRSSILRDCLRTGSSIEETRAQHVLSHQQIQPSQDFLSLKRDMDDILDAVKRRKLQKIHITPPPEPQPPAAIVPSPVYSLPKREIVEQHDDELVTEEEPIDESIEAEASEEQHTFSTIIEEEIILNVVQLPHKSGFIQNQLFSHGFLQRDDYHIIETDAQSIQKKLRAWYSNSKKQHTTGYRLIQLGENEQQKYHLVKKLGQGGMAHVYLVQNTSNLAFYGLKVQQPPNPWEFYILNQLHERKKSKQKRCRHLHGLPIFDFYQYTDTSFLFMAHIPYGTLLDALNLYLVNQKQQSMPESIALLFTYQLLKEINALHSLHITHNDLKLDNIMLMMNGEKKKRKPKLPFVVMIDFGRSIDLLALDDGERSKCTANWPHACPQSDYPLLNQEYYPIQADYWQLATMVHLLLFGTKMQYSRNADGKYKIQQIIKRYWHKELWKSFFDFMLNPPPDTPTPSIQELIQEFEKLSHDVPEKLITTFLNLLLNA